LRNRDCISSAAAVKRIVVLPLSETLAPNQKTLVTASVLLLGAGRDFRPAEPFESKKAALNRG
jgi:hypothetical protein